MSYLNKQESSQVKKLELTFGDYLRIGMNNLDFESGSDDWKKIYRTARKICVEVIQEGYTYKKRAIAPAALVLAGRHENIVIGDYEAAKAFDLSTNDISSVQSEIRTRLKGEGYEFRPPTPSAYLEYALEASVEKNYLSEEEKDEFEKCVNQIKNILDDEYEATDFHSSHPELTSVHSKTVALGVIDFVNRYMMAEEMRIKSNHHNSLMTQSDISDLLGVKAESARSGRKRLGKIDVLKNHKEKALDAKKRIKDITPLEEQEEV